MMKKLRAELESQGIMSIMFEINKEVLTQTYDGIVLKNITNQLQNKTPEKLQKLLSKQIEKYSQGYKSLQNNISKSVRI